MSSIGCAGGCGKSITTEELKTAGWSYMDLTGKYRCADCDRALAAAISAAQSSDASDPLPPDSIGALKKLPEPLPLHEKVKP